MALLDYDDIPSPKSLLMCLGFSLLCNVCLALIILSMVNILPAAGVGVGLTAAGAAVVALSPFLTLGCIFGLLIHLGHAIYEKCQSVTSSTSSWGRISQQIPNNSSSLEIRQDHAAASQRQSFSEGTAPTHHNPPAANTSNNDKKACPGLDLVVDAPPVPIAISY